MFPNAKTYFLGSGSHISQLKLRVVLMEEPENIYTDTAGSTQRGLSVIAAKRRLLEMQSGDGELDDQGLYSDDDGMDGVYSDDDDVFGRSIKPENVVRNGPHASFVRNPTLFCGNARRVYQDVEFPWQRKIYAPREILTYSHRRAVSQMERYLRRHHLLEAMHKEAVIRGEPLPPAHSVSPMQTLIAWSRTIDAGALQRMSDDDGELSRSVLKGCHDCGAVGALLAACADNTAMDPEQAGRRHVADQSRRQMGVTLSTMVDADCFVDPKTLEFIPLSWIYGEQGMGGAERKTSESKDEDSNDNGNNNNAPGGRQPLAAGAEEAGPFGQVDENGELVGALQTEEGDPPTKLTGALLTSAQEQLNYAEKQRQDGCCTVLRATGPVGSYDTSHVVRERDWIDFFIVATVDAPIDANEMVSLSDIRKCGHQTVLCHIKAFRDGTFSASPPISPMCSMTAGEGYSVFRPSEWYSFVSPKSQQRFRYRVEIVSEEKASNSKDNTIYQMYPSVTGTDLSARGQPDPLGTAEQKEAAARNHGQLSRTAREAIEQRVGTHFEKPPPMRFSRFLCMGQIKQCEGFDASALYVQYYLHLPPGVLWAPSREPSYVSAQGSQGIPPHRNLASGAVTHIAHACRVSGARFQSHQSTGAFGTTVNSGAHLPLSASVRKALFGIGSGGSGMFGGGAGGEALSKRSGGGGGMGGGMSQGQALSTLVGGVAQPLPSGSRTGSQGGTVYNRGTPTSAFHLGFPLEFDLLGRRDASSLHGQPILYVQVTSCDFWNRQSAVGYGYAHVPMEPGHHKLRIQCWRPVGDIKSEMSRFFIGNATQMVDMRWSGFPSDFQRASRALNKAGVRTESTGQVYVDLSILQHSPDPSGSKSDELVPSVGSSSGTERKQAPADAFKQLLAKLPPKVADIVRRNRGRRMQRRGPDLPMRDTSRADWSSAAGHVLRKVRYTKLTADERLAGIKERGATLSESARGDAGARWSRALHLARNLASQQQ